MKVRQQPWDAESVARLMRLRAEGYSRKEAARILGRSFYAVAHKLRRRPTPTGWREWSDEDTRKLIEMRETGASFAEIGEALGRTPAACVTRLSDSKAGLRYHSRTKAKEPEAKRVDVIAGWGPILVW